MSLSKQELALAIIDFLAASVADKTVSEEFAESIDVAVDCITDAFSVDKNDTETVRAKLGGAGLLDAINGAAITQTSPETPAVSEELPAETRAQADALKAEGNKAMAAKDFALAISKYTEAVALDNTNVVYLSNRAAAYSSSLQHDKAVADAQAAIELDPKFSKAYSRLGLAQYALGNAKEAMAAYEKGMAVEGQPSDAMKRGYETAKKRVEEELESSISRAPEAGAGLESAGAGSSSSGAAGAGGMPDLASMFGGGMPNLSEMMNNPQVMQAAQSLMSNPGAMEGLMNNPMLKQMASSMGGEGGLEGLMSNPALQNMARQFMGNQNNSGDSGDGSDN